MQGDTTRATLKIENEAKDIRQIVHDKKDTEILKWLKKTDPISNHTAARAKCEVGTGDWFISSHYWLLPQRSLWLHGIRGLTPDLGTYWLLGMAKRNFTQ